jgi:tetratricopeptide (TPR) repeat protein
MFFTGGMFDWLWQFPALGVLGLALLGMAAYHETEPEPVIDEEMGGLAPDELTEPEVVAPPHTRPLEGSAWKLGPMVPRLIGGLVVLAAGLSLIAPGIAARFVDVAYEDAATDPGLAIQRLDRAADLNPLSPAPLLAKNVLLRRQGKTAEAMAALVEAAEREPGNWFIPFERALLAARDKRWPEAIADLRRAKALNPRQVIIDEVLASTRRKLVFPADKAEAQLAEQTSRRLKPTD